MSDIEDFYRVKAEESHRNREIVRSFIDVVTKGDLDHLSDCIGQIEDHYLWDQTFRDLKTISAPAQIRTAFARMWCSRGDHLRSCVNNDLTLIRGLRALLPPYRGPALQLYRGEGVFNRRRRTYGLSWTSEINIARQHAQHDEYRDGSLLITTFANPQAIISRPAKRGERFYGEKEYLVDRRGLKAVEVLERYCETTS